MTPAQLKASRELARGTLARIAACGRGLAHAAAVARGDALGPEWVSMLSDAYGADSVTGLESPRQIAERSQRLRHSPGLRETGDMIAMRLAALARKLIVRAMESVYAFDQQARAKLYDAHTNAAVRIVATVTPEELAALPVLPIAGKTLDEWLLESAGQWREEFRAAVVRSLAGTRGGFQTGLRAVPRAINRTFDRWVQRTDRIAQLAGEAAMYASLREFRRAFIRPEKRQGAAVA